MPFQTNLNTGNSSTAATLSGQLKSPDFWGNLGFGRATQPTPAPYPGQITANVTPTPTGGISFNSSAASAYSKPASSAVSPATTSQPQGLAAYVGGTTQTANGGTLATTGGQPSGFTPGAGYSIDTNGATSSDAITSDANPMHAHAQYADYVNALAQAQGYSPSYIAAQTDLYNAQAQGAQLGVNQAAYANQAFGSNQANNGNGLNYGSLGGATTDYVAGTIGSEQSGNAIRQAENTQAQTGASIALNAQQLQRAGNISAAQTQLQYSPTGMSGSQAITQYQQLQQQYPGAGIPPFNPQADPVQQYNAAAAMVAQSPAYRAGFQSTYTTPGGGTGIYSKLDIASGGFQQNSDGSYTLVPAAAAALGAANANIVGNQMTNLSNINSAIDSSGKTIQTMTQFMNQYGLNQSNIPLVNQIQNSTNANLPKAGALAALRVDLNTLQSDYAQFLIGRGGSVAGSNQEAADAIPNNISPDQINQLYAQMKTDGQNTADAISTQVNQALQGITTNTVSSTSGGSSNAVGSSWDNL